MLLVKLLSFLRTSLTALVVFYSAVLILVYLGQSKMVYIPARKIVATPENLGLAYTPLRITTQDGIKIAGWYIPHSQSAKTILFCHGNGGNISYRQNYISVLHQLGFNLLLFDYRGYGESEGEPHEMGTYYDAEAAWQYLLQEQGILPQDIIIYGESLGGGVASYLAEQQSRAQIRVGGLVLGSTFTSIPDRASELFPYLPVHLLAKYRYPTLERLPHITAPILVIHSPDDEIIPFPSWAKLYGHANQPKMFLELKGDHNTGFIQSLPVYMAGLQEFRDKYVGAIPQT
jgi:Hydrolases of the alpha/beta superfamily